MIGVTLRYRLSRYPSLPKKSQLTVYYKKITSYSQQFRQPVPTTALASLFVFTPVAGSVQRSMG